MVEPIRITHLITGLQMGGAEMMLYKLIRGTQGKGFQHHVLSLTSDGPVGEMIANLEVPVEAIGMGKNLIGMLRFSVARNKIRLFESGLLQTWLYHADFMGSLFSRIPVIWNVQNGSLDPAKSPWTTRIVQRLCIPRSVRAAAIVYCAENAQSSHQAIGYQNKKSVVIENGTDLTLFKPDEESRITFRAQYAIPKDATIIGHGGRWDAQKDYPTLLAAMGLMANENKDAQFVLCGKDLHPDNQDLLKLVRKNGLEGCIHLLGMQKGMAQILPAFDVFLLTSAYGEAFPNILGEAMACGVPCVSTDVGDAKRIIGDTGAVVPVGNSQEISDAVLKLLSLSPTEQKSLSKGARERIERHFSIENTLQKYRVLYQSLV